MDDLLQRLALALGIGLLIGLERGWRTRDEAAGSRAAGIRTFALCGLIGGAIGAIAQTVGGIGAGIVLGGGIAACSLGVAIFCLEENRAQQVFSATTWIAATLTVALGSYAVVGNVQAAAAVAVAAALVLALRETLHGWLAQLTWPELRSGLVLLAMTFIALPIMPDSTIGPFGGINPREVWLVAIVLAGASFAGYVAVKYFGERRGALVAGLAGGLVSSTAVTIANARRAAAGEGHAGLLAAGVAAASTVMFVRVCAIVLAINVNLLWQVAPPLIAAAAVSIAYAAGAALLQGSGADPGGKPSALRNPFAFWSVIGFAIFLGALLLAGQVISERLGGAGAIAGAAVVGLVDVDAITVALARLAQQQQLSEQYAVVAVLAAVATDTLGKIAIGAAAGTLAFAARVAVFAIAATVAALATLALMHAF